MSCSASWSWAGQGWSVQKLPVSSLLSALISSPWLPAIIFVPPNALLNSWTGKKVRTPRRCTSLSPASICVWSHCGTPLYSPQPKSRETSTPSITAELALVDHLAGLERTGHYPEPALARAARLRVDVVLEREQVAALNLDRGHVVARVVLRRHERAQRLVVDEIGHHQPKTRLPRALDARVVVALLGQRGRARPVHERRPSVHVARARLPAPVDEVLNPPVAPLLVGRAAGGQRVRSTERARRLTAMPVTAKELERGQVRVAFDRAKDARLGTGAGERGASRVDLRLGVGGASAGEHKPDWQPGPGRDVGDRETSSRAAGDPPFRRGAGRRRALERARPLVGQVIAVWLIQQVDPEGRGLHPKGSLPGCDLTAVGGRAQGVAPVHQRIASERSMGGGDSPRDRRGRRAAKRQSHRGADDGKYQAAPCRLLGADARYCSGDTLQRARTPFLAPPRRRPHWRDAEDYARRVFAARQAGPSSIVDQKSGPACAPRLFSQARI